MNSHFKKIRKGNTGKIGVWDIKKINENCEELKKKQLHQNQLTTVKDVLRKVKTRPFYPLISSLGVKMAVNIVNITKSPLYFHSRHEISSKTRARNTCFVNNKKTLRRGLGSQC